MKKNKYFIQKAEAILLTGATGVLGSHLLKELLATTTAKIFCLTRADDMDHAQERLHEFLKIYDPELHLLEEFRARVTPVIGDIRSENLGLSSDDYLNLQKQIDLTIHAAANTNLLAKYKNIKPINVDGTARVIDFALGTAQKAMSYVSTYTVVGSRGFDGTLVFKETDLDVGQTFEYMSYQQSKFEAEKLVRSAAERGLVWKIFRPGQIFGEAETGYYPKGQTQVSGLFYDILKTAIETGVAPRADKYNFDIVPVDYVSRGVIALSLQRTHAFETYHLTNPNRQTFSAVMGVLGELGYPVQLLTPDDFQTVLTQNNIILDGKPYNSNALLAYRRWYLKAGFRFEYSSVICDEFTANLLNEYGIVCPKIDRDLVGTYVRVGIEDGYFPHPEAFLSRSKASLDVSVARTEGVEL
jgi:thioester reductase-like protein